MVLYLISTKSRHFLAEEFGRINRAKYPNAFERNGDRNVAAKEISIDQHGIQWVGVGRGIRGSEAGSL